MQLEYNLNLFNLFIEIVHILGLLGNINIIITK